MKRIIALLLVVFMLFGLAACGGDSDTGNGKPLSSVFVAPEEYSAVLNVKINPELNIYLDYHTIVVAVECVNDDAKEIYGYVTAEFVGQGLEFATERVTAIAAESGLELDVTFDVKTVDDGANLKELISFSRSGMETAAERFGVECKSTFTLNSRELSNEEINEILADNPSGGEENNDTSSEPTESKPTPTPEPQKPTPPAPTGNDDTDWDTIVDYVSTVFAGYKLSSDGNKLICVKIYFTPTENLYAWRYYGYYLDDGTANPAEAFEYGGKKWKLEELGGREEGYLSGKQLVITDGQWFAVFDCVNDTLKVADAYCMFGEFNATVGDVFENTGEIDFPL